MTRWAAFRSEQAADGTATGGVRNARARVLKKEIRLRSLFSLAFGTIIGVGWITVLGSWLAGAGSVGATLAFFGGGVVMMVIGYAEAAGMCPVSGGEVAYVLEAWGTRVSFAAGWLFAFSYFSLTSG